MKNIEDKVVRVHRNEAMSYLKRMLDGYRSNWDRIYIGVTANPSRRWEKHSRSGFERMVLMYEAVRPDIAIELERDLSDYAHRCDFVLPVANVNPGGEGLSNAQGVHYLYIVMGERKR